MSIKKTFKSAIKQLLLLGRPINRETASISVLGPNELLRGRNALITGGTSGIGLAIAKSFLLAGANVVITGRSQSRIDAAVAELKNIGSNRHIQGLVMDNSDVSSFEPKLEQLLTGGGILTYS